MADHGLRCKCAGCDDARHAASHPGFDVDGCTACKLSRLQFGSGTGVTTGGAPPRQADPAWERGIAGSHRSDGSFMPLIHDDLSPIHVKEAGERRTEISDAKRRLAQPA